VVILSSVIARIMVIVISMIVGKIKVFRSFYFDSDSNSYSDSSDDLEQDLGDDSDHNSSYDSLCFILKLKQKKSGSVENQKYI
jgi:hypothetical protein